MSDVEKSEQWLPLMHEVHCHVKSLEVCIPRAFKWFQEIESWPRAMVIPLTNCDNDNGGNLLLPLGNWSDQTIDHLDELLLWRDEH